MDSFKRNIILFVTFSILIVYMIAPANADEALCMVDLKQDNFNTDSIDIDDLGVLVTIGSANLAHAQRHNIDHFITPYGKVYYKKINTEGGEFMYPIHFCKWINEKVVIDPNQEVDEQQNAIIEDNMQREILRAEIAYYKDIYLCMIEISEDHFDTNSLNSSDIFEHAQNPIKVFTTPYGKAYRESLIVYKVNLFPKEFCIWLHGNFDILTAEIGNILKAEIANNRHILTNLCVEKLEIDHFNIQKVNPENVEYIKQKNIKNSNKAIQIFKTSYGVAYRNFLRNIDVFLYPAEFCYWINESSEYTLQWKISKSDIAFYNCMNRLQLDGYNINTTNWRVNRNKLVNEKINILMINSLDGHRYRTILLKRKILIEEDRLNAKQFCQFFRLNNISNIN